VRSNLLITNVYKKRHIKSEVVTQLLFGDNFKKIKKYKGWIKIKNDEDNYKGYIKNKQYPNSHKNTHKIYTLSANLYSKPNNKSKISKKISFGSKIKVLEKVKNFYKFENLWIKKKDLKKIDFKSKNIFKNINKFVNVSYKWGGKHYGGIDCSALVQLFLNFNNKFCPRDAKDQIKYFKRKITFKNAKKNDLIFWKGHVGIFVSKTQIIHAYGPLKKTIIMPIKGVVKRIYKTANLKVIGIRRVNL